MQERPLARRQLRGIAAIEEALDRRAALRLVLCVESEPGPAVAALLQRCARAGIPTRTIAERERRRLLPHGHDASVIALEGREPVGDLVSTMAEPGPVWLLVGGAYPGNAGYFIRSAEVSGAAGVVVAADFDRTGRRDCLRFAMRADRFFPVHFEDAARTVALARETGRRVIAVEDVGKQAPWQVDLCAPCLVVIGGEQAGVPQAILDDADAIVRVPMHGFLPSYNLQAAMAVVVGEQLRQREAGGE